MKGDYKSGVSKESVADCCKHETRLDAGSISFSLFLFLPSTLVDRSTAPKTEVSTIFTPLFSPVLTASSGDEASSGTDSKFRRWRTSEATKLPSAKQHRHFCTCMSSFFIAAMTAIAGIEVTAGGELLLRRLLMPLEEAQPSLE
nr:hypothetical protein Iba_chr13cCG15760 [Ipomoea batatas]